MILLGQDVLMNASKHNKPLRSWLTAWAVVVANAQWLNIRDVRKSYPSADGVILPSRTIITIFNVKGNNYRLLTWIDYDAAVVEALDIVTHTEYDKAMWKARY